MTVRAEGLIKVVGQRFVRKVGNGTNTVKRKRMTQRFRSYARRLHFHRDRAFGRQLTLPTRGLRNIGNGTDWPLQRTFEGARGVDAPVASNDAVRGY